MSDGKTKRDRSPSFPFIPLGEAIKRLVDFENTFGRHPAPASKAGLAWGMKENSSQAFQTLAALKAFGLVKYEGSSKDRVAILTEDARTYLRAQQDSIKQDVLRSLATKPAQLLKFWNTWGADRPIDAICLDELILNNAFTDSAANNFLKVYDATIDFAGLAVSTDTVDDEDEDASDLTEFSVGDDVNWENGGQVQWSKARKILAIDPHEDGRLFYKVEGAPNDPEAVGWIPVEQAIAPEVRTPSPAGGFLPPAPDPDRASNRKTEQTPEGFRKAIFPVEDDCDVTLIFPKGMSAEQLDVLDSYLQVFLGKEKRSAKTST